MMESWLQLNPRFRIHGFMYWNIHMYVPMYMYVYYKIRTMGVGGLFWFRTPLTKHCSFNSSVRILPKLESVSPPPLRAPGFSGVSGRESLRPPKICGKPCALIEFSESSLSSLKNAAGASTPWRNENYKPFFKAQRIERKKTYSFKNRW